jgi:hypothetical protein
MANKNLIARITYGELKVELIAEGASWYPDVADDLIKRMVQMWKETINSMMETDAWKMVDSELEDE